MIEDTVGQGIELCDGGGVLVVEWGAATLLSSPQLKASERAARGALRVKHPRALLNGPQLPPAAR